MNPTLIDVHSSALRVTPRRPSTLTPSSPAFRPAWWQWPHLLSLDAPLVALVWQRWWAHAVGITLPFSREWILGLSIWLIYLADRLADVAADKHAGVGTARHRFSSRGRRVLLPLTGGVALALAILTPCWLPAVEFCSGLGLLALAAGYFWLIHGWQGRGWAAYLPKEAVVGGMFGAGTILFVVCRSPSLPLTCLVSSPLFAAVCFFNCALITKWERQDRDVHERSSLLNAFPRFSARLQGACLALALAALAVSAATASWCALPVAFSALLLAALDRFGSEMSTDGLRILADIALLTPVFGLIIMSPIV